MIKEILFLFVLNYANTMDLQNEVSISTSSANALDISLLSQKLTQEKIDKQTAKDIIAIAKETNISAYENNIKTSIKMLFENYSNIDNLLQSIKDEKTRSTILNNQNLLDFYKNKSLFGLYDYLYAFEEDDLDINLYEIVSDKDDRQKEAEKLLEERKSKMPLLRQIGKDKNLPSELINYIEQYFSPIEQIKTWLKAPDDYCCCVNSTVTLKG